MEINKDKIVTTSEGVILVYKKITGIRVNGSNDRTATAQVTLLSGETRTFSFDQMTRHHKSFAALLIFCMLHHYTGNPGATAACISGKRKLPSKIKLKGVVK